MLGARSSHWSEYFELLRWLIPDVFRHARGKLIGMLALSGVGVGLRAASAAVVVLFVDAQQKGHGPTLLGVTLPSAPTLPNLVLWGSAGLLFAGGAVGASYRGDRLIYGLARTYVEDRARSLLRYVALGGEVRAVGGSDPAEARPAARMFAGSSLQLVRVVIASLSIVLPVITGLAAIAALFATQALLTALLIPIGIVYALLLGWIQRRTLRDVERRIEAHRNSRRDAARMLQTLERQRFPVGAEPRWLLDYPERSWLARSLDAYRSAVFAKRRIGYLGELFQGVSLLLILLVFGSVIAARGASWTVLLTYAVALGYAIRSAGSAAGFAASVNRALPKVRHYLGFLRAHAAGIRVGDARLKGGAVAENVLEVSTPAIPGSLERLALRVGEPVLCVHPMRFENASLEPFCRALASGDPLRAAAFERELFTVQRLAALPERPIREHLPLHADDAAQWRAARAVLDALGVGAEFEALVGDSEQTLASAEEEKASLLLRLALRLLPGLLSSRRLVALDHDTVEHLDPSVRARLFAVLADRVVLLTASRAPRFVLPELNIAIVVDMEGVRGIGDAVWFDAFGRPSVADWGALPPAIEESDELLASDGDADDDE